MFIVCPNCKQIKVEWPDTNIEFTNHVARTEQETGIPCLECYSDRKIMPGSAPSTCRHGRPFNIKCRDCQKEENEQYAY